MKQVDFDLYGWSTPNGQKIVIALEEVNASYAYHPIDISKGHQNAEIFREISPDGKIPALVHHTHNAINNDATLGESDKVTLFESGAILHYLANRFPSLHGHNEAEKAQVMSWTFWQVGQLGPLAGQFGRFQVVSPANSEAVAHFEVLVWRCLEVMEKRLLKSEYLACNHFTVADIASFPWVASEQSYLQRYGIDWQGNCPALKNWAARIASRPAVRKALGPSRPS